MRVPQEHVSFSKISINQDYLLNEIFNFLSGFLIFLSIVLSLPFLALFCSALVLIWHTPCPVPALYYIDLPACIHWKIRGTGTLILVFANLVCYQVTQIIAPALLYALCYRRVFRSTFSSLLAVGFCMPCVLTVSIFNFAEYMTLIYLNWSMRLACDMRACVRHA